MIRSEVLTEYGSGIKPNMNKSKRMSKIDKLRDSELNRAIFSK